MDGQRPYTEGVGVDEGVCTWVGGKGTPADQVM